MPGQSHKLAYAGSIPAPATILERILEVIMPLACKICIAEKGLRGSEIDSLPQTEEELFDHMEKVHHMPVQCEGETHEECIKRFLEKYPEARTCPGCISVGAEWTKPPWV